MKEHTRDLHAQTLALGERGANARQSRRQVAHDHLRLKPQHGVPRASERTVAPRIGFCSLLVVPAVDLDDEPQLWNEQVGDVLAEHGHLPAKRDAEPPAAHALEEQRLGGSGLVPHPVCALLKLLRTVVVTSGTQGLPPGPGKEAGHGPPGAGSVTCVARTARIPRSTARSVRPRRARPPSRAQATARSALERRATPMHHESRADAPRVRRAAPPPCARSLRPTRASPASLVGRGRARIWGRPQARRRRLAAHVDTHVAAEHLRVGASPGKRNELQSVTDGVTTETYGYDGYLRRTSRINNEEVNEYYAYEDATLGLGGNSLGPAASTITSGNSRPPFSRAPNTLGPTDQVAPQNVVAIFDSSGGVTSGILYDGVDHPLRLARSGFIYYYEVDLAGNVRRLRDTHGNDLGGYRYTAFGEEYATDADTPPASVTQPLQWKGRWASTLAGGIYDIRARQWSPGMGVFLQVDEFEYHDRGSTLWGWGGQSPVAKPDPAGRMACNPQNPYCADNVPKAPSADATLPHQQCEQACVQYLQEQSQTCANTCTPNAEATCESAVFAEFSHCKSNCPP